MALTGVGRGATGIAVAVLALNALLLGAAGLVAGRPLLLLGALAFAAAAVVVVLAWRRHRRRLAELAADRAALSNEARSLRDLLRPPTP